MPVLDRSPSVGVIALTSCLVSFWAKMMGALLQIWVAMVSIGAMYYLIPRMFGRLEMYSVKLIDLHFWVSTIGVVLYISAMWIAGVMQGLMWRAVNADGTLTYSFAEVVKATYPYYTVRLFGGLVFFCGMLIMDYNVWRTIAGSRAVDDAQIPAAALAHA